MNSIFELTKVNVLGTFKKNSNKGFIIFLFAFIYLGFLIFNLANNIIDTFIILDIPYILLVLFMIFSTLFILLRNTFNVNGTLFNFKDYDLLMSLPLKKEEIIISKVLVLYAFDLLYTILFMIPAYISFVLKVNVSFLFHLLFFITLFIIPILPTIISTILGTIITAITSKFKNKNIVNYSLYILFFILYFYITINTKTIEIVDYANIAKILVDKCNNIYPLTNVYLNIIQNYNIVSLLIYILIPIIVFIIVIKVLNKYFITINNKLSNHKKKGKYILTKLNKNSKVKALYKKELKRYFKSPIYVTNTMISPIMIIIMSILLVVSGVDKVGEMLEAPNFASGIALFIPFIMAMIMSMSPTTHSSISLEGKNLWIIKSIPVEIKEIFYSKIMVNLTITIIPILFSSTILSIFLELDVITIIYIFILPIIYVLFSSIIGLIYNLKYPNFNWKSETAVVKQSRAVFMSLITNIFIATMPLMIPHTINNNLYMLLVTLIMILLTTISYIYLMKKGKKVFKALY